MPNMERTSIFAVTRRFQVSAMPVPYAGTKLNLAIRSGNPAYGSSIGFISIDYACQVIIPPAISGCSIRIVGRDGWRARGHPPTMTPPARRRLNLRALA